MKAIILTAGEGTRLRPYTLDRPKCMVEIEGISLLERQLAVLRSRGVTPIILVGGYKANMLNGEGYTLRLNPRYAETNMVWTLFCAQADLEGEVIVSYGDIVYSGEILDRLMASTADIAVTIDLEWEAYWRARNEDPLMDAESLRLDPSGYVIEIGKKPTSLDEIDGQYMGLMKFSSCGLEVLRTTYQMALRKGCLGTRAVEKSYMTDLLQAIIERGFAVRSVPVKEPWVEVDTVEDLISETSRSRLDRITENL